MATMDAKQLHDVGKQIAKADASGDGSDVLLNLLAPLDKIKVTEDLLRQSKIGVTITKLRQNKDSKVCEFATRLVNRWKAEVSAGKKKAVGSSPAPAAKAVNTTMNGRSGTSSPAPPVKAEAKADAAKKYAGDPKKRNTKVDGVDHNVTGDKARDGCLKLLYDGIAFMSPELPSAILDVARQVESAAFELYKGDTNGEYRTKVRSLYANLKMESNKRLRKDVLSGAIPASKFVAMTTDELKSAEKRAEDAELEKENMSKAMTAVPTKAVSETIQCGKCKGYSTAYSTAQTRGADEPLTMFCECTICGNRWRQG